MGPPLLLCGPASAGVEALGSLAYARSRGQDVPELQDLVGAAVTAANGGEAGAGGAAAAAGGGGGGGGRGKPAKRSRIFEEHKPMSGGWWVGGWGCLGGECLLGGG